MNIKKYLKFLGIIIFVVILWKIDLGELIRVLSQIKIFFFVCALALVFPLLFIKSLRWNFLLKRQGISYHLSGTYLRQAGQRRIGQQRDVECSCGQDV